MSFKETQPLWFGITLLFGIILGIVNGGYFYIDYPYHLDCKSINIMWQNSCNSWYGTFYTLEIVLGSIFGLGVILYFISRGRPNYISQKRESSD